MDPLKYDNLVKLKKNNRVMLSLDDQIYYIKHHVDVFDEELSLEILRLMLRESILGKVKDFNYYIALIKMMFKEDSQNSEIKACDIYCLIYNDLISSISSNIAYIPTKDIDKYYVYTYTENGLYEGVLVKFLD
jgi:hypothetical protein